MFLGICMTPRLKAEFNPLFSKLWDQAKNLENKKKFTEAEKVYLQITEKASKQNSDYWLFYAHRNLAKLYCNQKNNSKQEEHLLLTIKYVNSLYENKKDYPKHKWLWEKVMNMGYLEYNYSRQCRLGLSYKIHRDTISELTKLVNIFEKEEYDIFSGKFPKRVPKKYLPTVTRTLWRESFHLDIQGKTHEAIKVLKSAQWQYPADFRPDYVEINYQLKILNQLAIKMSFLGYSKEGMQYHQQILDHRYINTHQNSKNIARGNLLYDKVKYYGPKDEYLQEALERYNEACRLSTTGDHQLAKKQLFKITALIDPSKAQAGVLKEIAKVMENQGENFDMHYAKRDLTVEKLKRGETEELEPELLDLLSNCRKKGIKRGEPTIYREYARLLEKLGRYEESVQIMEHAIVMTRNFNWYLHLPRLLNHQSRCYVALNDYQSAQKVWQEIDRILEKHNDFPQERLLEIMIFRMEFLLVKGEITAAQKVRRDTEAFLKHTDLPPYQTNIFTNINWDEIFAAAVTPAEIGQELDLDSVELQPASILTKVIPGEEANARFTLINESYTDIEGTLRLKGAKSSIKLIEDDNQKYVQITATSGSNDSEITLNLKAGTTLPLIITSETIMDEETKHELQIDWHVEGLPVKSAYWQFQANASPLETAIVNSNLAWLNPFYSIPLYHTIFNRTEFAELTDICVESTVPCRVEIYNGDTEELLAVDNNANGSFFDKGDTLSVDDDQSGLPELTINRFATVLLKVFPIEENDTVEKDFILTLKLKVGDNWVSYAQNRIILPDK